MSYRVWLTVIALFVAIVYLDTADAFQSRRSRRSRGRPSREPVEQVVTGPQNPDSFTFVRVRYSSSGGYGESWYNYEGRDWERWETDFPRAELNFLYRLQELTSLKVNPEPLALELTDPRLFDHPFCYMSDVGWQQLSGPERAGLRTYLERGGFLWVDDFWGDSEWENFELNMAAVAPDWRWQDLPDNHPLLSIVYPLDGCPQVPARIFYVSTGLTYDPPDAHRYPNGGDRDLSQVHMRGLFDSNGRLVVLATHNTDVADGWEREGEAEDFFQEFSVNSYAMGINVLFYAMTH